MRYHKYYKLLLEAVEGSDSFLENDPYYYKLKKEYHELNNQRAQIKKDINNLKLALKDPEKIHPNALARKTEEELEFIEDMRNMPEAEVEARIETSQKEQEKVNKKFSALKQPFNVMTKLSNLETARNELAASGMSERAANYIVSLYASVLEANLLSNKKSSYYKNLVFDFVEETPGISGEDAKAKVFEILSDVQRANKYPELIKTFVTYIADNEEFTETFEIEFGSNSRGIVSNLAPVKEDDEPETEEKDLSSFPVSDKIVGKDDNWITYLNDEYKIGNKLRSGYYKEICKNNKYYAISQQALQMGWCITYNNGYYNSQKSHPSDEWYLTVAAKDPINTAMGMVKSKVSEEEYNNFIRQCDQYIENGYNGGFFQLASRALGSQESDLVNKLLGEAYLRKGEEGNQSRGGHNLGHHIWTNPGAPRVNSALSPAKTYDYENLKIGGSNIFEVDRGVLKQYNGTDPQVIVPMSVKEIGEEAFLDNTTVEEVVLLYPVTRIRDRAFAGCTNLKFVRVTHNLHEIERTAFEGIEEDVILGVFNVEDGRVIVEKPKDLYWYPKNLNSRLVKDDTTEEVEEKTESKTITIKEATVNLDNLKLRLKRPLYSDGMVDEETGETIYYIEKGLVKFNPKVSGKSFDLELVLPSGSTGFGSKVHGHYREIRLPNTFREINIKLLEKLGEVDSSLLRGNRIEVFNMQDSSIIDVPPTTFTNSFIKTVILPDGIRVLGGIPVSGPATGGAFKGARIMELYVNFAQITEIESLLTGRGHENTFQGFNNPRIRNIYTDDPLFLEVLSGRKSIKEAEGTGSRAEELYAILKKEMNASEDKEVEIEATNKFLTDPKFRAKIMKR